MKKKMKNSDIVTSAENETIIATEAEKLEAAAAKEFEQAAADNKQLSGANTEAVTDGEAEAITADAEVEAEAPNAKKHGKKIKEKGKKHKSDAEAVADAEPISDAEASGEARTADAEPIADAEAAVDAEAVISDAEADGIKAKDTAPTAKAVTRGKPQKPKSYTSGLTAVSVILHIVSFAMIIAMTAVFAVQSYLLVPYYTFWPFVGVIVMGVLALVFMIVTLTVTRKRSKKSIRRQTVSIVITFFCLTFGFGFLMTSVFPDVIAMATQRTLFTDDLYYNAEEVAEEKASLVREFIRYNLLNGNYDPALSYRDVTAHDSAGNFDNDQMGNYFTSYRQMNNESYSNMLVKMSGHKKELYDFVYNNYVLMDYEYAFTIGRERQCVALAYSDIIYSQYEKLCSEGMNNQRIASLLKSNFASMDQDGYLTFDDPLLLYAQMDGRMTVPIVLRLILDSRYTYTEPVVDEDGNIAYDGYLYEIYDPDTYEAYLDLFGDSAFAEDGFIVIDTEVSEELKAAGQRDVEPGWILYENGIVKKPMKWIVLDMDGNNMSVVEGADISGLSIAGLPIGQILVGAIDIIGPALGDLLTDGGSVDRIGLIDVIKEAAGGAALGIQIYMDDNGGLNVAVVPNNVKNGVLGYMQMSWLNSNNLLFAVITLISTRESLYIFGAIGLVLLLVAGMCREQAYKRRAIAEKRRLKAESGDGEALPGDASTDKTEEILAEAEIEDGKPSELTPKAEDAQALNLQA
jgi:hypothetical protein